MKHFSIINRSYSSYRVHSKKDKENVFVKNEIKQSGLKFDLFSSTKLNLKIEEDWIIEIEEGIKHIAQAVAQDRQFIATTGEVIPIEKVKKVSKASIVHLAKHSDLISRLPEEGEILTPDKVYMEEKVNDYAIYENRFLYTLIYYLQQFVNMRQEKINEIIRTYKSNVSLNKNVNSKFYNLSFELNFKEERFDVLNPLVDEHTNSLIERIEMISREIISLLATPLMKEVCKAPLVKQPLVKTNVLKNNKNFKALVLLFDYINAIDKDGYSVEEINETFNPFSSEVADDFAEVINLTSYIAFKHGNNYSDIFKKEIEDFELEEKRKQELELKEKIDKIKNNLISRDMSIEEYVLMLEKRNTQLESENDTIELYKKEIDELKDDVFKLGQELEEKDNFITKLNEDKEELNDEIIVLNQKLEEEISSKEELIISHEEAISNLENESNSKFIELEESSSSKFKELEEESSSKIKELEEQVTNARELVKEELDVEFKEYKDNLISEFEEKEKTSNESLTEKENEINEKISQKDEELNTALEDAKKANNDKAFAYAQLLAMRIKMNIKTQEDDYTSKERFQELEEQYFAFEQFFSEEWKRTKKKIRKKYLGKK